jgi:CRP-like cAMP-binding protein
MSILEHLKNTILADGLDDDDLAILSEFAQEQDFHKNEIIFRENEQQDSLFVLLEGKVAIERRILPNQHIGHTHIQNVRRGQLFGEMGFLEKRPRSATAIAKSHVKLLRFTFDQLNHAIEENQKLGLNLYRAIAGLLSRRLRRMNDQWIRTVESSSFKEFEYY